MKANADATQSRPKHGFWGAAHQHPVLVAFSALLLFVAALIACTFLSSTARLEIAVNVVRLDLDHDASSPSSLIRTAPLSLSVEEKTIRSDHFIESALARSQIGSADLPALKQVVLSDLAIEIDAESDTLLMSIPADAVKPSSSGLDVVNAIAMSYVDLRNQERKQQKEDALSWADKKLEYWHGAISILTSSETAPSDRNNPAQHAQTEGKKLLGFFIDAVLSAQVDILGKVKSSAQPTTDQPSRLSLDVLEDDYAMLLQDQEKLENISLQIGQTPNEDGAKPSNLQKAEDKLALFRSELDTLISSGLLDTRAAAIVHPVSAWTNNPLYQWPVIIPAMAALSIVIALVLVSAASRWLEAHLHSNEPTEHGSQSSVLSDPHWPMNAIKKSRHDPA